ncbi:MAG: hypothetical protein ACXADH_15195, partial [Candidatus Kariarchaeaceae archaeon]
MGNSKNQEQRIASSKEIDARQFLKAINSGARSQHNIFESKIKKIGEAEGLDLRLVTLNPTFLMYEDVSNDRLYRADIERQKGGKVKLTNVHQLKITEAKKANIFSKACQDLVEALAEDNNSGAENLFERIAKQRFRSRVIPESGWVTTRDGQAHHVSVSRSIVPEVLRNQIVNAVCESLSSKAVVKDGQILEAVINDSEEKITIPITEHTRRVVVARHMKEHARDA